MIFSCARPGYLESPETAAEAGEELLTAEEDWIIPDGPVQRLRERTWNLHHQKLWVRFDFNHQKVPGKTELLFTSKSGQEEIILDAKTMVFEDIYDVMTNESLSFKQDSATVTVSLDKMYTSGDTLTIGLRFISSPPERGLYFVNPVGSDPVKPTQIWTLGQPEDNSFWFPTIDHPAERATQETWISVPPQYTTLSNGLLMESRVHPGDSLRTDYWSMNKPHAPYLFAIAVGEYEVTEEIKGDILFRYYTEPQFTNTADLIYDQTAEMIRFSENLTGVSWPWDPVYSQAPVHDYIARGMENTTATILYDAVQFDKRGSQDLSNRDLIMHEIIHHWFGNLVTARDWANLPLNEGFANYFEGAFVRYSEGENEWLWKNQNDRLSYFEEAGIYRRSVIFDRYTVPEDMYDRHTYQKAGQILRMLHDYLGDEIWWKGVNRWLTEFSFQAVDVQDLQYVFEDVSGEDLNWFFHQWFHSPGHPYLELSHDIRGSTATVSIAQIQDTTRQPVFQLYPEILFVLEDGSVKERVELNGLEETWHFDLRETVTDIIVDPDRVQLAEYFVDTDLETLLKRIQNDRALVRSEALSLLDGFMDEPHVQKAVMEIAGRDPFWGLRVQAFQLLTDYAGQLDTECVYQLVIETIYPDERQYAVRQEAVNLLINNILSTGYDPSLVQDYFIAMSNDTSYFVSAESIRAFGRLYPDDTVVFTEPFITMDSYQDVIREAVTDALISSGHEQALRKLVHIATMPGDRNYTYQALQFLIGKISEGENELNNIIRSVILERLEDPYSDYRMLAYDALIALGAVEWIDRLYEKKQQMNIDETERRAIHNAIRALEYERDYVD